MASAIKLRRSVLYMPGANERALDKARTLSCDGVIFDLEDAVAADAKTAARANVVTALRQGGYGHRELVVRVNGLDTPWGADDIAAVASAHPHAVLFPKVQSTQQIDEIVEHMDRAGAASVPLWFMIETPRGVLDVDRLTTHCPRLEVLVMGTSDLVKELRAEHTESRHNLAYALQRCVLAARAAGLDLLDGVHLDFRNDATFRAACRQAREMGFDGKSLIHPTQIEPANEIFGFAADMVEHARRLLAVWNNAQAAGKGVAVLDGKLVENLHAVEAERVLAFAAALAERDQA
jgi:citrate lyase subunit beta / citryl-CoA lyase